MDTRTEEMYTLSLYIQDGLGTARLTFGSEVVRKYGLTIMAEPKGEASNRDALSFRVGMYVCMYIHRLRNAILCLCMYIHNACIIQSYARICMSVMLV